MTEQSNQCCCFSIVCQWCPHDWSRLSDNVWSRNDWMMKLNMVMNWLKNVKITCWLWLKIRDSFVSRSECCSRSEYDSVFLFRNVVVKFSVFNISRFVCGFLYRKVCMHAGCLKWSSIYSLTFEWSRLQLILCVDAVFWVQFCVLVTVIWLFQLIGWVLIKYQLIGFSVNGWFSCVKNWWLGFRDWLIQWCQRLMIGF